MSDSKSIRKNTGRLCEPLEARRMFTAHVVNIPEPSSNVIEESSVQAPAKSPTFPAAQQAAYVEAANAVMAKFQIPGAVFAVRNRDGTTFKTALGMSDVENKTAMSTSDYFEIRSITKSFTVTLILELADRKLLSLDDPISKYVPGIPNGSKITLTQLAAMESGIKNYTEVDAFLEKFVDDLDKQWTASEIVGYAIPESPVFKPGKQYDYSNTNTLLLGIVAEKVSKLSLSKAYQKFILNPLGLTQTFYPNDVSNINPKPQPYEVNPATGKLEKLPEVNLSSLGAAGGMVSSIDDLLRWGRALGTGELISKKLFEFRMHHSRKATNGPDYDVYGLGMGELKGWWGHTGEAIGYQAATFYDAKSRMTIAVMLNSSQPRNIATEMFKALADVTAKIKPGNSNGHNIGEIFKPHKPKFSETSLDSPTDDILE